ncbi:peptidyl-prolyl cis-trans isomerase [Candidatus Gracilibacteria bacterium]|nr:peptidyl-prolyl cis-trans isomerase [Candidatus Gracilibacteria bacterium]
MKQIQLSTSLGNITLELDETLAPITVANFCKYVEDDFYNGTIFHRVIPGFMIQGGGFEPGMIEKETRNPIAHEGANGLKNLRGTIAMARTNNPTSATSQFFINTVDNGFLDFTRPSGSGWGYAVFGKVIEGMEILDQMEKVSTSTHGHHDDVPREDIVIKEMKEI